MTSSNRDHGNYDQFAPNFDMAFGTIQSVLVPNLKSHGPIKIELWTKEVEEISIMVIWENGLVAYQHGCHNINVWRLSKV